MKEKLGEDAALCVGIRKGRTSPAGTESRAAQIRWSPVLRRLKDQGAELASVHPAVARPCESRRGPGCGAGLVGKKEVLSQGGLVLRLQQRKGRG